MNKLIAQIEVEGKQYGMSLNKDKCEVSITGEHVANIHFANGEKMKKMEEVKYLGCH